MNWKRILAPAAVIGAISFSSAVTQAGLDGPELTTSSLKVAYNFNFACAITNENPFAVSVGRIEVLDSNGNVRAFANDLVIQPEQTRQVFAGGQNDRYHCDARDVEAAGLDLGPVSMDGVLENLRMIFDVQSGGNTIAETEGRIVEQEVPCW